MTPLIPPPPETSILELYEELINYVRQRQGIPDFGRRLPELDEHYAPSKPTVPARRPRS